MGHFVEKCEHGTIGAQCRCPSPVKEVRRIPCPPSCPGADNIAFTRSEEDAQDLLLVLDPIVSAQAEAGLEEHARENMGVQLAPGVGVNYLRLSDAVDAVGWETAITLPEIARLVNTARQL